MLSPPTNTDESLFAPPVIWGLLTLLVITTVPLFVCAPVTSDVSLFDVQAMTALRGGVLYRDVLEPNLPGIVWVHMIFRSIAGWSSEAVRVFDLLVLAATLLTFGRIIARQRNSFPHVFVLTSALFYLTRNEWCHCQRDIWMMLPVSLALLLRIRRSRTGDLPAVAEGIIWGIAFWIKPHVAIPAAAIFAVDSLRLPNWKARVIDVGAVITGGIIAAIPGVAWLIKTGAWPHFWDMALTWNPEYVAIGKERQDWSRLSLMMQRFYPWWCLHLVAVPIGIRSVVDGVRHRSNRANSLAVLSTLYLAWIAQSHMLQHAMDYIHVPEYLLAIVVISAYPWQLDLTVRRVVVSAMLLLAAVGMPQLYGDRMSLWSRCFTEGSTPEVRSVLAQGNMPDWKHLEDVRSYLQSADIGDKQLTCLNGHSIHLHKELGVLPATRYWCVTHPLTLFPSHGDEIMQTVEASSHRFVVVDAVESSHPNQILPKTFPSQFPIVFQSGPYTVHKVTGHHRTASRDDQNRSSLHTK